jgi:hypothetical protein
MLKYHCNPADPEAMALLQEISCGPSPPWRPVEEPQPAAAALPRQAGSVMSSTSGRVALAALPWSTSSAGWTSGCSRKHQWIERYLSLMWIIRYY